jgi:hypothetical protein
MRRSNDKVVPLGGLSSGAWPQRLDGVGIFDELAHRLAGGGNEFLR